MKYAVTHSGRAHRDEFYCAGLACFQYGTSIDIFRRDPTEAELNDPEVLVFDVGRRYEPDLNNFDHHQMAAGVEECALSLMAAEYKIHGVEWTTAGCLWKDTPWYKGVVLQDSLGLPGLAKRLNLPEISEELVSGIEIYCLQEFASYEKVPLMWKEFTRDMIAAKIRTAIEFGQTLGLIDQAHKIREIVGVGFIFWAPTLPPFAINQYIDRNGLKVVATATKDPRNGGVCLYRLTDTLDFTQIKGEPEVSFAHAGGYMAVIKPGTAWERIAALLKVARRNLG